MTLLSKTVNPKDLVDNVEDLVDFSEIVVDQGFYFHIVGKQKDFFVYVDKEIKFTEILNVIKRSEEKATLKDLEVHTIPSEGERFVWERKTCLENKVSQFI